MTMVPIRQIDTMAFLLAASLACAQPFSGETIAISKAVVLDAAHDGAVLATVRTARGAHCVTADGNDAYVRDPDRGRLLVIRDSYLAANPSVRRV